MQAGRMNYRVTVLRRATIDGNPGGNSRGDFAEAFKRRAAMKQGNGFKRIDAGLMEDQAEAVLRLYADADARTITIADRVRIVGPMYDGAEEWAIESVSIPDAQRRHIEISISRRIGG
jgi:head-tail adaptor